MPVQIDQLIRSRRKTVAIQIRQDGLVIVHAPMRTPLKLINAFVESKNSWITQKKALALKHTSLPGRKFITGEKIWLTGEQIPLRVVSGQRAALALQNEFLLSEKAQPQAQAYFEKWFKTRALQVLGERVNLLASRHGFKYGKIHISSARTRWGSCSTRGTLSFTWRLVMAPPEVIDYVVIHELAHLKIKNHSPVFWAEVARLMPAYKHSRDWLKKNGHFLTLD